MPKPAAYLRVSTSDQRERETILSQELALRQYYEKSGLDPDSDVLWFRDDGISGDMSLTERGEGAELVAAIRAGLVSRVDTFSISRLSRDAPDYFTFTRILEEHSVPIRAISQGIDTSLEGGDFTAGILALVAAKQKRDQLIASKAGHIRMASAGKWQGEAPYGYRLDLNHKLESHPQQAQVVWEIYRLFVEEGYGAYSVARELMARGIPRPRGGLWYAKTLLRILSNPAYVGRAEYNKSKTIRKGGKVKGYRPRDPSEWIIVTCPPLVEEQVWLQAQRLLDRRSRRYAHTGRAARQFILPRVACALCGRPVWPDTRTPAKDTYTQHFYYRHDRRFGGNACPGYGWTRARPVEARVWERIEQAASDPAAWMDELREQQAGQDTHAHWQAELSLVADQLAATQQALERAEEAHIVRGTMSATRYDAISRGVSEQQAKLLKRQRELQSRLSDTTLRAAREASLVETLAAAQELVATATQEEQRALVDAMINRVLLTLRPDEEPEIGIEWNL